MSRVTTDHKTGEIVMNSKELQLACVWVLRGTVSSKDEIELLEKCLITLKWADEAGRQLQHPEENLEHALAVSAAADMIQNVDVDWTFTKFMDFRKILNSRWNVCSSQPEATQGCRRKSWKRCASIGGNTVSRRQRSTLRTYW